MGMRSTILPPLSTYLSQLASTLPRIVLASRPPSSIKTYAAGWQRWKECACTVCIRPFPALPLHVALYLQHLLESAQTISPIECAIYSVSWAHSVAIISSPTQHAFVTATFQGCKIILAKPRVAKKPIQTFTLDSFIKIYQKYATNLDELRILFVLLVGYEGFLRISEILHLQVKGEMQCPKRLYPIW